MIQPGICDMDHAWFILVNPHAGQGKAGREWAVLHTALENAGIVHEVGISSSADHIGQLVEAAIQKKYHQIISVGGDGTHHFVVNAIMRQQIRPAQDILFCPFPVGTGNDWIRTHGYPNDLRRLIDLISRDQRRYQDLLFLKYVNAGKMMTRYVLNVAGCGYDAEVVKRTTGKSPLFSSRLFYLRYALTGLMSYTPPPIEVRGEGFHFKGRYITVHAGPCKYSGGGMQFLPHADPFSGQLAVTLIGHMPLMQMLFRFPRIYAGRIVDLEETVTFRTTSLDVHALAGQYYAVEADGEFLGQTPLSMHVVPSALQVLHP